jgi:hypothetical protein
LGWDCTTRAIDDCAGAQPFLEEKSIRRNRKEVLESDGTHASVTADWIHFRAEMARGWK